jgi:hypothetical protein
MSQSEGERFRIGRFKISNQGFLEIRDIDANNQKLIVKLRISGVITNVTSKNNHDKEIP